MKKIVDMFLALKYVGYMNLINKIKRLVNQFLGLFPSHLPVAIEGSRSYAKWSQSIRETYPMPTEHVDSIDFVLTNEIIRLDMTKPNFAWGPFIFHLPNRKSKAYFARLLWAVAAKQIAGSVFREIKERENARIAAEEAAAQAAQASAAQSLSEATSQVVPISGP